MKRETEAETMKRETEAETNILLQEELILTTNKMGHCTTQTNMDNQEVAEDSTIETLKNKKCKIKSIK